MKISGLTFARNTSKLYYPIKESIESILPIVDEFIVALGDCDEDDTTEEIIRSIQSDKIKIIRTVWDPAYFPRGMEYARQTDLAMKECSGDWLFYIQSDEVIHEKYLPAVKAACEKYLDDEVVEGFLFDYKHFWGDFDHYVVSHAWYPKEIRLVRNKPDIHSWRDAQSFRRIPNFDGKDYYQKEGAFKLNVVKIDACIHHYGFVRPPSYMQKKRKNHSTIYKGAKAVDAKQFEQPFDYGDLSKLTSYKDSQPAVMKDWIARFDWADQLRNFSPQTTHKHDKPKYRFLTFIEQNFLGGNLLFGFKNYRLLRRK